MSTATPGRRVRVLMEIYDPALSQREAEMIVDLAEDLLRPWFSQATFSSYVEENPPADEVA